ncbi:MAG TPA: hypothetical protein VJK50_04970 [Patescibacteria group bacterium]|nr:hypothetical protein [Patescibacteria group bacterium]
MDIPSMEVLRGLVAQMDLEDMPDETLNTILVKACQYLATRKRVPLPVFQAKLKIAPVVSIELVTVYRKTWGEPEFLMWQRPTNDLGFPGQWHCAGTTLLNQETVAEKFAALGAADETDLPVADSSLRFAGWVNMPKEMRAHYASPVFVRHLTSKPEEARGTWITEGNLRNYSLVASHRDAIIPMALRMISLGTGALPCWTEYVPGQPFVAKF